MTSLAERVADGIQHTLMHHRLSRWQDQDGEPFPLTDLLTPEGQTIQVGYDEIEMICDSIYNEVLLKLLGKPDMDVTRAEFEQWHVLHFIEPLDHSKGGSDYKDSNVQRRWEAWQGANEQRPGGDLQLMKFYGVKTTSELIAKMEEQISRLQLKIPSVDRFPRTPREG